MNTCCSLIRLFWMSEKLGTTRKIDQNIILQREDVLTKKNFWRLARSYRNGLITCVMSEKKNFWTRMNFSMWFVMLGSTRQKTRNFFTGTLAIFSNCSVRNNPSGFWEVTYLFAPKLLENFVKLKQWKRL